MMKNLFFILMIVGFAHGLKGQNTLFSKIPAGSSGIDFMNAVKETADRNISQYDYFYNGGGLALGDINNDGLVDVFLAGNDIDDQLYLNKGNLTFQNISATAGILTGGWSTGVTMEDVNKDGWLDIYVCRSGPDYLDSSTANLLYINQQDGTFHEQAALFGIAGNELTTQAIFFDMDRDGDQDIFVLNHAVRNIANSEKDWLAKTRNLPAEEYRRYCNTLYENRNGSFVDITQTAGMLQIGFGLGAAIADFDQNGSLDIYVANDFFLPDNFWVLESDKWTDLIQSKFSHVTHSSMGCDVADLNNDSWPDLLVLDMSPSTHEGHMQMWMDPGEANFMQNVMRTIPQVMHNTLFLNNGGGLMTEVAQMAGVQSTDWSWAALFADFSNDGQQELFVSNGYRRETMDIDWRTQLQEMLKSGQLNEATFFQHLLLAKENPVPNFLFFTKDAYAWEDISSKSGLDEATWSNGAVYGDLDNDGDLDLVINNLDASVSLYRNNTEKSGNHFIRFQSKPEKRAIESVSIFVGSKRQTRYGGVSRGFQSAVEPVLHFGLGNISRIDSAEIRWQDGKMHMLYDLQADQTLTVGDQDSLSAATWFMGDTLLFINQSSRQIKPTFFHFENDFDEGRIQRFIATSLSNEGPAMAIADVNGDGLSDFYMGGARKQRSVLYMQDSAGLFTPKETEAWEAAIPAEEVNALFFDADQDGDMDLFVASGGGGDALGNSKYLHDILYMNDGQGNFSISQQFPEYETSTKALAAGDFDGDGDVDLFVGGRNVPGLYPQSPVSYVWRNDGSFWTDVTDKMFPDGAMLGNLTEAAWTDWNQDGTLDLLITGEWMPPNIYLQKRQAFQLLEDPQLSALTGIWNTMELADLDSDGDMDLLLGNMGQNGFFHPSPEEPVHLYAFPNRDRTRMHIIYGTTENGIIRPMENRAQMMLLIPDLDIRFPDNESYAKASLAEIVGKSILENSIHLEIKTVSHYAVYQREQGQLEVQELPKATQVAPVYAYIVHDWNQDAWMDICLAGNNRHVGSMLTPMDAGIGLYLEGTEQEGFIPIPLVTKSGFYIPNDVRHMGLIQIGKTQTGILVAKNSGRLNLLIWDR